MRMFLAEKLSVSMRETTSSLLAKHTVQIDNQDCLRLRRSVVRQFLPKNASHNS